MKLLPFLLLITLGRCLSNLSPELQSQLSFIGITPVQAETISYENRDVDPKDAYYCSPNKHSMITAEYDEDVVIDLGWKTCGWEAVGFQASCNREYLSSFHLDMSYFKQKEVITLPQVLDSQRLQAFRITPGSYIKEISIRRGGNMSMIQSIVMTDSAGEKFPMICSSGGLSSTFSMKHLERIVGFKMLRRSSNLKSIIFYSNILKYRGFGKATNNYNDIMELGNILRSDKGMDTLNYLSKFGDTQGVEFADDGRLGHWRPAKFEVQYIPGGPFRAIKLSLVNEFTGLTIDGKWRGNSMPGFPSEIVEIGKENPLTKIKVLLMKLNGSAKVAVGGLVFFFKNGESMSIGDTQSSLNRYSNFNYNQFPVGLTGRAFGDVLTQLGFIMSEESPFLLADMM